MSIDDVVATLAVLSGSARGWRRLTDVYALAALRSA
jgi:hypothetical protein